jgi:hypothetical protein
MRVVLAFAVLTSPLSDLPDFGPCDISDESFIRIDALPLPDDSYTIL